MVITYEDYLKDKRKRLKEAAQGGAIPLEKYAEITGMDLSRIGRASRPQQTVESTISLSTRQEEKKDEKWYEGWFKKSEGNLGQTFAGSTADATESALTGGMKVGEGFLDTIAFLAPILEGVNAAKTGQIVTPEHTEKMQKQAQELIGVDLLDEEGVAKALVGDNIKKMGIDTNAHSVFDAKTDSLFQSAGQLATTALLSPVVPWFVTTGASSFGAEAENASRQGATYAEAGASGLISAGAEILTEKISGAIKFGGKTLDEKWVKPLTENISNSVLRTMAKLGFDATGEGAEEVVSQVFSNLGSALYKEEDLGTILGSKEALDGYIESFIGGAAMGGAMGGGKAMVDTKKGIDYATELTQNEKAVVDAIAEERFKEAEKNGKKLSLKEKSKIRSEIEAEMDDGAIDIDKIESILGGDDYKTYKDTAEKESRLLREEEALKDAPNTIGNAETIEEIRRQIKELKDTKATQKAKDNLYAKVQELTKNDRLVESYNEKGRRGQAYEADLTQYDTKQQAVIQKAIDSGILNNTNRTHKFVDMIAKISADKGVSFDFTNNQKLKESGFSLEGKTVNGYIQDGNISLNINSAKALNKVVGHEITHVLEGTELYDQLQDTIIKYAQDKGDYDARWESIVKLYRKQFEGQVTDERMQQYRAELTADLVGDYLFSDPDFVNKLSTEQPTIFQKIFDEIKYMVKVATAGSKEEKQLLEVKRVFDKAYKEGNAVDDNIRYSLGKIVDANNNSYGIGVHLDSTFLDNLSSDERIELIKEYVKELGGQTFGAYDSNGNKVDVTIATSKRFKNKSGKKVPANKDLQTKYIKNETKQEAIALVDELVLAAKHTGSAAPNYSHDWLDNNGKNAWEYWTTYIQDKNKTIWEATLNIANSSNGEKILYDISPIKKVGQAVKSATSPTNNSISQNGENATSKTNVNDVYGRDITLDIPIRSDIAPVQEKMDPFEDIPIRADAKKKEDSSKTGEKVSIIEQSLGEIARKVKRELGLNVKQGRELKKIIKEYGENADLISADDLHEIIKSSFGTKTEHIRLDDVADAKYYLRKTRLKVSDSVKSGIDNFEALRRANFGKIRFSKDGIAVDELYGELSSRYPDLFPIDVLNQSDQFDRIVEVANMSREEIKTLQVDEPTIRRAADIIVAEVRKYARMQKNHSIQSEVEEMQEKLKETKRARDEAHSSYNVRIAQLQNEYDANPKKEIMQKISDVKEARDNTDSMYESRIASLNERIAKLNSHEYKRAKQRMTKQEEYRELFSKLIGDTSTWVDKKMGIYYKLNTLRRNLRDIVRDENGKPDYAKADAIYDELQGNYNHHEAQLNREANEIKQKYREMKITPEEDAYIQMLGEYRHNPNTTILASDLTEFYRKHKAKIDDEKVDRIIDMAREMYDDLFVRVNEVLREQGMQEIQYHKGYFPHFTEDKQGPIARLFGWKTKNDDIPTDIAGLTETFNPDRSWQSFNKHRTGDSTDYSFMKGLDNYVQGSLDWIYHIEDIQKRRALENEIRYRHSEKAVQEKIEKINANEEYSAEEAQEQIDMVLKEARNPLNNFVSTFRTQTNTLAGKKSSMDREAEQDSNRRFYSTVTNLSNRVNANMVGGSISSALTNFIPITQSWAEVSPVSSLQAMKETISSYHTNDGTIDKSDFLTNRLRKNDALYKSWWDKAGDKIGWLMEACDDFTSQTVWRSKYMENISSGMSEAEAIKNADQFAENLMAGRSRGNAPAIFDSKRPDIKMLTAFQLEVNNQYQYMFKDLPQEMQNETKGKLVAAYGKMFVGAYVYNAVYSAMTGRDAAFDPISIIEGVLRDMGLFDEDEEKEPGEIVGNLVADIIEEVPFVGGLMGGGRIPISSALPYDGISVESIQNLITDISEGDKESIWKEILNPAFYLLSPAGGGGQLRKTLQGMKMFDDDLPIAGSYTNSGKLRFSVDDDIPTRLQAAVFGQYASKNARDYFDNGRSPLTEKQTRELVMLDIPIRRYWDYRQGLKKIVADKDENGNSIPGSKKQKIIEYIDGLDVDFEEKLILFKYQYPSDNTYNYEILEYLKGRTDISDAEKKVILKDLDFTVDENGNVRW